MQRLFALTVISGAVLTGAGCSDYVTLVTPPPAEGASIPILSEFGLIIDAKINDVPTKVMIDTGTVLTSLASPRAIGALGLEEAGENPFVGEEDDGPVGVCGEQSAVTLDPTLYNARTVDLGGVLFENLSISIFHEEDHDTFAEAGIDLIISASILMRTDWEIDGRNRLLILHPLNSRSRPEGADNLIVAGPDVWFVPQRIGAMSILLSLGNGNNDPVQTLLDTGAGTELAISNNLIEGEGWDDPAIPRAKLRIFAAGGQCETEILRAPRLSIGDGVHEDVLTINLQSASGTGLLGIPYMTHHASVYVAPGGGWIHFKSDEHTDDLFTEPLQNFGMGFDFNDDGQYEVISVRAGSSAEAEGVQTGDLVLEVNGIQANTVEGKSELLGRETTREGQATFLIQDSSDMLRVVDLTPMPIL